VTGILHCCGGEHSGRVGLARRAIEVFGLDGELLDVAPPPAGVVSGGGIPRDTRLDATATARALGVELPDLTTMLERLKTDIDASASYEEVRT
jgi:dTDP-4-dehydrorhamnose reductase